MTVALFKHRSLEISTAYGLSNGFIGNDRIDQSNALSPLLWRIFYDPLLVGIQQSKDNIIPNVRHKQVIFIQEFLANSNEWLIGKVNKIHHHTQGISVNYHPGYNDNGTIGWQNTGQTILTLCCKRAILDRDSNSRGWNFPVQNIWIYKWIDDDNLKSKLMDIKNVLAERTMVEYYTDGSLRPSIPTSRDKQYPNLVYIKMGATFCVNDKPALSAQANLSLWSSSTHSELVAIFLALLTNPMNVKIKIYTDSQSAIYMINNKHNKSGRKLLKQSNSLILLKINILLQEKKMKLVLVKVKGHRRDVMNEMLGDTSFELDSIQPENLKDENLILSKCYRMEKKAQDQICVLINNNW
ncbi:hypothetical protein RhiirA5_434280 [Rhizophagus irregularis]|uniref:RNase H type-1 domain-containing protein n=1 Tax=Rhizophagus irregularis TaxID=588596 RepID=A0A2N0NQC6_9GLOM|nr:hypothetical protein RhiirA5_434280 [Rhizophagus irregularis]